MSLTLPYWFEPKSWIKIINIRYTIPDFERKYVPLTEPYLVPTKSKEASLFYKKMTLFPELLYFFLCFS